MIKYSTIRNHELNRYEFLYEDKAIVTLRLSSEQPEGFIDSYLYLKAKIRLRDKNETLYKAIVVGFVAPYIPDNELSCTSEDIERLLDEITKALYIMGVTRFRLYLDQIQCVTKS